jgi:glycine/D-amino acid oxidase-like deaminating enzyme/nitrite reductase/ring-hydroxylating ferredoxin subunit
MQSKNASIWTEKAHFPSFPTLNKDLQVEVAIVGGGLTGITTAYLLARKGVKVVVLESEKVGSGTTGFSTGHLTSWLDADYSFIASRFSKETARKVAQSMNDAINLVENICRQENIDADFVRLPAYQFAEDESQVKELEDEAFATTEAGLINQLMDSVPLPFSVKRGLKLEEQGEFNALRFVEGLSQKVIQLGGQIFTDTHVTDVDDSNPCVISTKNGPKVTAQHVVLATHTPIQFNMVQTELLPYMSYVVVAKLNGKAIPKALYWDTLEFYHYIRTYEVDGQSYLVVGGEDHKVGERSVDENEPFRKLEEYIRSHFGNLEITHRWSAEYFYSADGLPYIGRSPFGRNKYIATGYTGDGLTFSVAAATVLSDLLTNVKNPMASIYDPARFNLLASATDLAEQNLEFLYKFVKDRFSTDAKDVSDVPRGEGRLVRVEGQQLAVYRDEKDTVHMMSPVCTHMHCVVQWNGAEKSWDCPCHGGRFHATGEVLVGPPVKALAKHEILAKDQVRKE